MVSSYSISYVASADITRSIQERPLFFPYVYWAGGPGWMPFKICQPCISHTSITHGARGPIPVSKLNLGMSVFSGFGYKFPMRAFQSPHIVEIALVGIAPAISSTRPRASSSRMPRFFKFPVGGR